MILGIDASNIRGGGGVTHLVELLGAAEPQQQGFERVIVWGSKATLSRLKPRPWLDQVHDELLDRSLPWRVYWQRFQLGRLARKTGCHVLFIPGGSHATDFSPVVTMSQNLLPFEWRELRRYGLSVRSAKLVLLRLTQSRSFRDSAGVIFLSDYAKNTVLKAVKSLDCRIRVISHGIDERFFRAPRQQFELIHYSFTSPFRILYVSIIDAYKHQWHVARAVSKLRKMGWPIELNLVGPAYPPAMKRLRKTMNQIDPEGDFVHCVGAVDHGYLQNWYEKADLFLFASSCENMPNILLEGMASGLPVACSGRGPMPEILGSDAIYFDPENIDDISAVLQKLLESPELRQRAAENSFSRAKKFSWARCSGETFKFLAEVVNHV